MFAAQGHSVAGMNFIIRHPPWTTVAGKVAAASSMLIKASEKMISTANVIAASSQALKNVNEIHSTIVFSDGVPGWS